MPTPTTPILANRAEGQELSLPPLGHIVKRAAEKLSPGSLVLDVGAWHGTNGLNLAVLGHRAFSVELNIEYIEYGMRRARSLGNLAARHTFVRGDMRQLETIANGHRFDLVTCTRGIQEVGQADARNVLKAMQKVTKPAGYNAVQAYIATAEQQAEMPHLGFLEPEELPALYEASDWRVMSYDYALHDLSYDYGKPNCISVGNMLARQTNELAEHRARLIAEAQRFYHSDPEFYDVLMEQAQAI